MLLDEEVAAGRHDTSWAVDGLAAGLYVVRLEAAEQVLTQRVVVTR
jgi:hypothetical protein